MSIIEGIMVINQQWQKRKMIVEENKQIEKYKKQMERQYGYKFKDPVKLNPNRRERLESSKAYVIGADDKVVADPAVKLV